MTLQNYRATGIVSPPYTDEVGMCVATKRIFLLERCRIGDQSYVSGTAGVLVVEEMTEGHFKTKNA